MILPFYLSIGLDEDKVLDSNPSELQPYIIAQRYKRANVDRDMWQMGMYVLSAVSTAVQHSLAGRKSNAKYVEKPILEDTFNTKDEDLTEEEIIEERKKLLSKLMMMGENFKANKELRAGEA